MNNAAINGRIRDLMERRNMNQTILARKANLNYRVVHLVVNGRRRIYADELTAFCRVLEVSPAELLGMAE